MDIIIILQYFFSFLLIWQFVGYSTLMGIIALKSKPENRDYNYQPFVSIIVPAYNEEAVIGGRIENLLNLDYPNDKYEILVVDDGSTDNTAGVVKKKMEEQHQLEVRLIKNVERKGKASAVTLGKGYARGSIVLITDANSSYDENVLKEMMLHFKNPKVGAVSGRYIISNTTGSLTSSEAFYWEIEHISLLGESRLDSVSTVIGTISAWRKELLKSEAKTITEDLDSTIQVRRKGYKIKYEPNAVVYETSATTTKDQITQRKRTSLGTIQNMFKHWRYFIVPNDWYSLVIFPSHKALTMFSSFILMAIPVSYVVVGDIKMACIHFFLTLFVFSSLVGLLLHFKSKLINEVKITNFSITSIPKITYYVLLNEYLILLAWKDFVLGRYSVLWEKTESTR